MDWLEYMKAEGFLDEMSPQLLEAHKNLREGQKAYESALAEFSKIQDPGSPLPALLAIQLLGGLAVRSTNEAFLALQWSIAACNKLDARIRELESRLP